VPRALLRWTLFLFANLTAAQTWTDISWIGVPVGRIASIAVDPADSSHWLAGFGNGGVWETHDGGGSWFPLSDNWPTLATGAIAFAPSDPKTIYVGTGEADVGNVGHSGIGIMKSIDAGKTWTLLGAGNFARGSVGRILVQPTNANIVLAATTRAGMGRDAPTGVPSSPSFGILRSNDGGMTWARTLAGQATALEIDPTNFNNQYAAIGDQAYPNLFGDSKGSVVNGIYRSTDGGQTWALISGPWGPSTATIASVGRVELAISPSNPGTLYASIQVPPNGGPSNTGLLGLYRTDNAWDPAPTWIQIPIAITEEYCNVEHVLGTGITTFNEGKCGYSHVISVDPSNPDTLFAGGVDLWRCTNCGKSASWTDIDATVAHSGFGDYHALVWSGSRLICGSDHTISSSTDRGQTWRVHSAGLSTMTFYSGAVHPSKPGVFLTGVRDLAGVALRSESAGWQQIIGQESIAVGEAEVAISSMRPDTDWMGAGIYGAISRTMDGGQSWTEADAGIDKTGAAFVAPVRKCPSNDNVFLNGTYRVWRTDNFFGSPPPTWVANGPQSSSKDPLFGLPPTILEIEFVASDTTCNTYVYGNSLGQVQLTRDGGHWVDLDPGKTLPSRPVNGLAFDPTNPNILYAALSSFDDATPGKPGHIFRTTNALAASPTWLNVSPPLNQPFNVIRVDPTNSNLIYAGSDTGLWHSSDGAATWVHDGPQVGLPNASVYDIKINPATGTTAAFTYGRGAYVLGPGLTGGSAVNGATYFPDALVPGSWASVTGTNLAGVSRTWADADFVDLGGNLPVNLSGVQVTVNGVAAAVYYESPTQINFQVPAVATGAATVKVLRDGVPSNTIQTQIVASSPGIFPIIVNGTSYPAGVYLDGKITGDPVKGSIFRKARPGDVIQLYATGLAPSPAGTKTVNFQALSGLTVTIGNVSFPADATGLVAAGEFQINFTVPQQFASMPEGNYPITIQVNGVSSPMNINSQPPAPVVLPIQH